MHWGEEAGPGPRAHSQGRGASCGLVAPGPCPSRPGSLITPSGKATAGPSGVLLGGGEGRSDTRVCRGRRGPAARGHCSLGGPLPGANVERTGP